MKIYAVLYENDNDLVCDTDFFDTEQKAKNYADKLNEEHGGGEFPWYVEEIKLCKWEK